MRFILKYGSLGAEMVTSEGIPSARSNYDVKIDLVRDILKGKEIVSGQSTLTTSNLNLCSPNKSHLFIKQLM